mgnify:FL=1
MRALFGVAGVPEEFYESGLKSTVQAMEYLEKMGLDCFEYQCGHGVQLSAGTAGKIRAKAEEHGVSLSLHAPYYISLSSSDEQIREKSVGHILKSARALTDLGGVRMVVHSGSLSGMQRGEALELAADTLRRAQRALDENGYGNIVLCPETMGKIGQLGTAEDVAYLCGVDERMTPTIDFGHLNARTFGALREKADFLAVLDLFIDALGMERMRRFHCHFSRIAWSNGGEKAHLTFADESYGPPHIPFLEAVCERGLAPVVICESAGTQAKDAKTMKDCYESILQSQ